MVFSPDGSTLGTVGYNGTAHLHQIDQDRYRPLFGTAAATKALAFLDNERVVSITDNGTVAVLGPQDPEAKQLEGMDGKALNVVTSADGKLIVAGSTTGAIGRWDGASGTAKPALKSEQLKSIAALAMSIDGGLIAAGGPSDDPRIEIWDNTTGRIRTTLTGTAAPIISIMFQPRGQQIAATSLDGKLRIWDTQDGSLVRTIAATPQQRLFSSMTFSPDGSIIATGSPNGDIVFWNAQTGEEATQLPPRDFGIFSLAISPNGERLAAGVGDETIRVFELGKQ